MHDVHVKLCQVHPKFNFSLGSECQHCTQCYSFQVHVHELFVVTVSEQC